VLLTQSHTNKKAFKSQVLAVWMFGLWLATWYLFSNTEFVNEYLLVQFGSFKARFLYAKLFDLMTTLSFTHYYSGADYSPFGMYSEHMKFIGIYDFPAWQNFFQILNAVYVVIFIYCFVKLFKKAWREKALLETFLIISFLLFCVITMAHSNFAHVFFRLLLFVFPIQFLILSYGANELSPRLLKYFLALATVSFVSNSYFNYKTTEFQELTGKTIHRWDDTLEIALRYKLQIYDFIKKESHFIMEPFEEMHGRAVNKMRFKEFNWEQRTPYFGLFRISGGREFKADPLLRDKTPENAWYVHFLGRTEILQHLGEKPYTIEKMKLENLPANLVINYLDKNKNLIRKMEWKNTNMILPFAFFDNVENLCYLRLQFEVDPKANKYFNIAYIGKPPGGLDHYMLGDYLSHELKIDGKAVQHTKRFYGLPQVQRQYIYELSGDEKHPLKFDLELEVNRKMFQYGFKTNYFRLDLYGTEKEPVQEEIFEPQEFERDNYRTPEP
jgi:hypothetical protein